MCITKHNEQEIIQGLKIFVLENNLGNCSIISYADLKKKYLHSSRESKQEVHKILLLKIFFTQNKLKTTEMEQLKFNTKTHRKEENCKGP